MRVLKITQTSSELPLITRQEKIPKAFRIIFLTPVSLLRSQVRSPQVQIKIKDSDIVVIASEAPTHHNCRIHLIWMGLPCSRPRLTLFWIGGRLVSLDLKIDPRVTCPLYSPPLLHTCPLCQKVRKFGSWKYSDPDIWSHRMSLKSYGPPTPL